VIDHIECYKRSAVHPFSICIASKSSSFQMGKELADLGRALGKERKSVLSATIQMGMDDDRSDLIRGGKPFGGGSDV
jgi:hypothetical protein